jgi:ribosomal protein S18 acetylase RimI-like enzyme
MEYRDGAADDIGSIATLHAENWRRHYRGILSDGYLDHDVWSDRRAKWEGRLRTADDDRLHTVVAVDGGQVVGFVHTVLAEDARWGALLDNLHVAPDRRRGGIATRLMALAAAAVVERTAGSGMYLWVLEGNVGAQAFYEARGGVRHDRDWSEAPGGGTMLAVRYAWPDPAVLI